MTVVIVIKPLPLWIESAAGLNAVMQHSLSPLAELVDKGVLRVQVKKTFQLETDGGNINTFTQAQD